MFFSSRFLLVIQIVSCVVVPMSGLTYEVVRVFPSNCSLFRARMCWGGGGGSVAFEG